MSHFSFSVAKPVTCIIGRCKHFWSESAQIFTCITPFNIRHLTGEQLDKLTLKELQQLEQQLDTALKKIRSRKVVNLLLNIIRQNS